MLKQLPHDCGNLVAVLLLLPAAGGSIHVPQQLLRASLQLLRAELPLRAVAARGVSAQGGSQGPRCCRCALRAVCGCRRCSEKRRAHRPHGCTWCSTGATAGTRLQGIVEVLWGGQHAMSHLLDECGDAGEGCEVGGTPAAPAGSLAQG
jgi:hypothetical protein